MNQPAARKRRAGRNIGLCLLGSALIFSACAGENLFSVAAASGELGPTLLITAPTDAFSLALGDSILISVDITASQGAGAATYSGNYSTSGDAAFVSETETLGGLSFTHVDNYLLAAAGQVAGNVYIVIEVTDQTGGVAKDSVKVVLAN